MAPKAVRRRFRELGWEIVQGSDHAYAVLGSRKVRLPSPHGSDVSVGLLKRIVEHQAGLSRDQWLDN